jgi:hypothetical protein
MIASISEDRVWSQIVAKAWCDEQFLQRLLSEPRAVLAEHDLNVPDNTAVDVVLGADVQICRTDAARRFVLPATPPDELIEEDLGGGPVSYCYSGACGRCGGCGCRCRC